MAKGVGINSPLKWGGKGFAAIYNLHASRSFRDPRGPENSGKEALKHLERAPDLDRKLDIESPSKKKLRRLKKGKNGESAQKKKPKKRKRGGFYSQQLKNDEKKEESEAEERSGG